MTDPSKITEVVQWRNKYVGRVDVDLNKGWPHLKQKSISCFKGLSWRQLACSGPGEEFEKQVEGVVGDWVTTHVQPIVEDSQNDLQQLLQVKSENQIGPITSNVDVRGIIKAAGVDAGVLSLQDDGIDVVTLPLGIAAIIASIVVAITTTTTLLIVTTTTVAWPILIGGLVIGGILSLVGAIRLGDLREKLIERVGTYLMPRIKQAILGPAREDAKEPSLRERLQDWITKISDAICKQLAKEALHDQL